jgi:phosphotransferase system HPr (HPr) family protein
MSASCEQGITLAGDLHARPAGALAVAAGRFTSAVSVTTGDHTADAKSVLGVMGLGATSGQRVTVSAAGPDAREAVAALITILGEATKVGGLIARPRPALRPSRAGPGRWPGHARRSRRRAGTRPTDRSDHRSRNGPGHTGKRQSGGGYAASAAGSGGRVRPGYQRVSRTTQKTSGPWSRSSG